MHNICICGCSYSAYIVYDYYAFELLMVKIYLSDRDSDMIMTYEEFQRYCDEYDSHLEQP